MVYLLCPALLLLMSGCESEVFLSGQPEEGNSSDGKVRVEIFQGEYLSSSFDKGTGG